MILPMGKLVKMQKVGEGLLDFFLWWSKCGIRKIFHWLFCKLEKKTPIGHDPSQEDKGEYAGVFPNLKTWSVTSPDDPQYNCIAWTVGITNQSIWPPGDTVQHFDAFYAEYGLTVSNSCDREYKKRKVALYGFNSKDCRHASIETHDCGWHESKLGSGLRIMHIKTELEGGQWGNIIRCYEKHDQTANLDLC
jgi:hypothetical protein